MTANSPRLMITSTRAQRKPLCWTFSKLWGKFQWTRRQASLQFIKAIGGGWYASQICSPRSLLPRYHKTKYGSL